MALHDRILITGGGGMLAYAFRQVLKTRGVKASSLERSACDIANTEQVAAAFDQHKPTLVINCAAYTKVDLAEKERESADACNAIGQVSLPNCVGGMTRHSCTSARITFSIGTLRRPLRPDDPVGPQSAYGQTKLDGEQNLQKHAPSAGSSRGPRGSMVPTAPTSSARWSTPPRPESRSASSTIKSAARHTPRTLAEATLDLLDAGASGVWHVANSGQTSWFDFARAIFEEWGLNPEINPITSADWKAIKPDSATRPTYSVFDLAPLEQTLGRPIRTWRKALSAFKNRR